MIQVGVHIGSRRDLDVLKKHGIYTFQTLDPEISDPQMTGFAHFRLDSNLANPKHIRYNVGLLQKTLDLCEKHQHQALVIHPGIRVGDLTEEQAKDVVLEVLYQVFSPVPILVETDPGSKKGTRIGSLETCLDLIDKGIPGMGLCLDT